MIWGKNPTHWSRVLSQSWWSEVGSESEFHQGLKASPSSPTEPPLPWTSMYSKFSTDFVLLLCDSWTVFFEFLCSQSPYSLGSLLPQPLGRVINRYICPIWFFPWPHWFDHKRSTLDSCLAKDAFCLGNFKFGSKASSPSLWGPWKWLLYSEVVYIQAVVAGHPIWKEGRMKQRASGKQRWRQNSCWGTWGFSVLDRTSLWGVRLLLLPWFPWKPLILW